MFVSLNIVSVLIALFVFVGNGPRAWAEQRSHEHSLPGHGEKTTPKKDLTMIQVMQDLAMSFNRLQSGILSGNRLMIEEGARSIAEHPMPAGGPKPYIKKNADKIAEVLPGMDEAVHHTAVELKEKAATASLLEMQGMANKLASGCVACHDFFRDK
ncbi:MAG: hypothetical protein HY751_08980 [Nitrospinae bacterium]|nr:hypothetical protein [Nitrospinota bacterium]